MNALVYVDIDQGPGHSKGKNVKLHESVSLEHFIELKPLIYEECMYHYCMHIQGGPLQSEGFFIEKCFHFCRSKSVVLDLSPYLRFCSRMDQIISIPYRMKILNCSQIHLHKLKLCFCPCCLG